MKKYLTERIKATLPKIGVVENMPITIEAPRQAEHGDMATNVAMTLARELKKNPRQIAEEIIANLDISDYVSNVEVAGAGFINFKFDKKFFQDQIFQVAKGMFNDLEQNNCSNFGKSNVGNGIKTNVEYVSANPTGPLHTGHAIGAALGDTIANLLHWTNHSVTREYYFNNAGNQMRNLALSVQARYYELLGLEFAWEENFYQGEYIKDIAKLLAEEYGNSLAENNEENLMKIRSFAEKHNFIKIKQTLLDFNVKHEIYYNEDSLYTEGKIKETIDDLSKLGMTYEKDGALWITYKEDGVADRVIVKSTGEPTYRLPDIAYHREKFRRGFEYIIDVFGADHIATAQDVVRAVKALGFEQDKIKIVMNQMATFIEGGEVVKFSKRSGKALTLETMIEEFSADVVRFFFVMRGVNTHLTFDIDLAREQSDKNPLYYLQYAHARVASVLRHAQELGHEINSNLLTDSLVSSYLIEPQEIDLIKEITAFPDAVSRAARELEPQILAEHLRQIAAAYHRFYHDCRIIVSEDKLRNARLILAFTTKIALANGLQILGVSAPEQMYKTNEPI